MTMMTWNTDAAGVRLRKARDGGGEREGGAGGEPTRGGTRGRERSDVRPPGKRGPGAGCPQALATWRSVTLLSLGAAAATHRPRPGPDTVRPNEDTHERIGGTPAVPCARTRSGRFASQQVRDLGPGEILAAAAAAGGGNMIGQAL
ncbi:unnamed protein product [Lampetra fluviatilis]